MANPEHLAILRKGVAAWNAWRKAHAEVRPELTEADLGQTNPREADLGGAELVKANLVEANLTRARLERANLTGALLLEANLMGADLRGAQLGGAILVCANLLAADLEGADVGGAELWDTVFGRAKLARTIGLNRCNHYGPSVIDVATLQESGPLPLAFLRGCGLPDDLINLPSSLNQPIQYYPCFISHSTRDAEFSHRLHADLQNKRVRCWFAPKDLKIGDRVRHSIDEGIHVYDKLLLVLSNQSLASDWVEYEVEVALQKERELKRPVLFPIRIDDGIFGVKTGWANDVLTRHVGDFRNWKDHDAYRAAFEGLLRDLKADGPPANSLKGTGGRIGQSCDWGRPLRDVLPALTRPWRFCTFRLTFGVDQSVGAGHRGTFHQNRSRWRSNANERNAHQ